ncbi:MAG: SpoIVB peptidase, partial [Clostridia bacterium]|nr:SpoIVB peptidase [Clostridia bacterium]
MPVYAQPDEGLYLGGFPAGFMLNTQNVEVVGLCDIFTDGGAVCPARDSGIRSGDVIKSINGIEITSATQLTQTLSESFSSYNMTIQRGGETQEIKLNPITDKSTGAKKLGLLVKDSINGIGTITYIDKSNNKFGSLGHPVTDNNGALIPINGGCLYG